MVVERLEPVDGGKGRGKCADEKPHRSQSARGMNVAVVARPVHGEGPAAEKDSKADPCTKVEDVAEDEKGAVKVR
jgi:hypothetical protein